MKLATRKLYSLIAYRNLLRLHVLQTHKNFFNEKFATHQNVEVLTLTKI